MEKQSKLYITATELAELLIMLAMRLQDENLNVDMEKKGYLIIDGRVLRGYFEKRYRLLKKLDFRRLM